MSTHLETRIQRLELEALEQRRTIRQLLGRLADLAQAARVAQTGTAPGGGDGGGGVVVRAYATGAIAEGAYGTLGSGPAQPSRYDHATDSWVDDGEPVTAYNQFTGGAIDEGTALLLTKIAGFWFVLEAGCEVDPDYVAPA